MKKILGLLLAFALAGSLRAVPQFETAVTATASSGTTITKAFTTTAGTHAIIIVNVILGNADTGYVRQVTWNGMTATAYNGAGNMYGIGLAAYISPSLNNYQGMYTFYFVNPAASTTSNIVVTQGSTINSTIVQAVEFSGVDQNNPLQGIQVGVNPDPAKSVATAATISCSLTVAASTSLVLSLCSYYSGEVPTTLPPGYVTVTKTTIVNTGAIFQYEAIGATGVTTCTYTSSGTAYMSEQLFELGAYSVPQFTPTPTPIATPYAITLWTRGHSIFAGENGIYGQCTSDNGNPAGGDAFRVWMANMLSLKGYSVTWVGTLIDALGNSEDAIPSSGIVNSGAFGTTTGECPWTYQSITTVGQASACLLTSTDVNDTNFSTSYTTFQSADEAMNTKIAAVYPSMPVLRYDNFANAWSSVYYAARTATAAYMAANNYTHYHFIPISGTTITNCTDGIHPADYSVNGNKLIASTLLQAVETFVPIPTNTPTNTPTPAPTATPGGFYRSGPGGRYLY